MRQGFAESVCPDLVGDVWVIDEGIVGWDAVRFGFGGL